MDNERLVSMMDTVDDILSSGYGPDFDGWHARALREMMVEMEVTDEEKKEFFQHVYVENLEENECITVAEIKFMRELCGVPK